MRYTDYSKQLEAIKASEKKKLIDAVRQHQGYYEFDDDNPTSVEFYGGNGPASAAVQRLVLDEDGTLSIEVCDGNDEVFDISPDDLYPGSASGIIANMDEPFRVGDKVRWNDPAIGDCPEEDRKAYAERVYTIWKVVSQDDIWIGDSTQVPGHELTLVSRGDEPVTEDGTS